MSLTWFLVGYFITQAAGTILLIGRPRKPIAPLAATIAVAVDMAILAWVLAARP